MAALDELTAAYAAGQARPALPRRARRPARATTPAGRRCSPRPGGSASRPAARPCCSSARTSTTPARTRSTTCSARRCSPSGWARPRVIAETGAGQHGVATATAAALLGLECVVYMGEEDTQRQALNVARMRMLGAEVIPVTTGTRTLKDAMNEAFRDWVTTVGHTHYCIGSVGGPHPFPMMVRDFQRVIGVEASASRCSSQPAGCRTRSSPASAAAPTPSASSTPSSPTPRVAPDRLRGRRRRPGHRPARRHPHRRLRRACCTACAPTCCRTTTARPCAYPLDLGRARLPGRRPRARLAAWTPAGPATAPSPTPQAMDAFSLLCRTEGIIPAIESRTRWPARSTSAASSARTRLIAGQPVRPRRQGRGHRRPKWFGASDRGRARSDRLRQGGRRRTAPPWSATCPPASPPWTARSRRPGPWPRPAPTSSRSACRTPTR